MQKQDAILEKLSQIEKLLSERTDEVLTFEQACQFLDLSKSHLYKLTSTAQIPHYKPNGKRVYFSKRELEEWLLRNPVKTNAEIDEAASDYIVNNGPAS